MEKYRCRKCGIIFTEEEFDISSGIETIVFCPAGCIIGTVYLPDICDIEPIKNGE